MTEAEDTGSTPGDWREVEGADGPMSAIWLTFNRIEEPAHEMVGITQLLLHLAASPSVVDEEALNFLACQLHTRVHLVKDAMRTGCDLAAPFANAEREALAEKKKAEARTPEALDTAAETYERGAVMMQQLAAESRAEAAAMRLECAA